MSRRRPPRALALAFFVSGLALVLSTGERDAVAQPKAPVVTPAPQAPLLTTPATLGAKPGEEVELTLTGTNLADALSVALTAPGKATVPTDNKNGTDPAKLRVKVALDAKCPIGLYTLRVATKHGVSNARPFVVDALPPVASTGTNRTKDAAQAVSAPCVASGSIAVETSEFYKVKVAAGQRLAFEVLARRIGSPLDPIVVLHDAKTKRELPDLYADDTPGLQGDCRLSHTFKDAGEVLVEVRDTTHRGGADFFYRLRIGDFPGATTAFPLAAERGKAASVGFAGPETIPAVRLTAPKDGAAFYAVPAAGKESGWPVPVLVTDYPQITEKEPNDDPKSANKLPVPGGVSAKFEKAKDVDHFAVTGKKGQKLVVSVSTFEVNSPAEVLVRVLDAKGAEVAKSNPTSPVNRFEFTPAADGEYVLACEHLNYLHGPNEIYLLTVAPAGPDMTVAVALDRTEAPAGGATAVMATVARLNGYAGPVELSIDGDPALSGKVTLAAGQTIAFVPLQVKAGTKAGAYPFRVKATVTAEGATTVTRYGTLTDAVKASLGGMPNPPPELLSQCAVGVVEAPAFALKLTFEPASVEKGKTGKILLEATRGAGADGDIVIAPLFVPPTVVPAVKPITKGQTKGEIGLTVQAGAPVGPTPLVFRATTKVGGKDHAFTVLGTLDVIEPKKGGEPKKDK